MDPRGPEKKERLLAALNEGMVMVHLDARRPGVMVPQSLRTEAHLRLNLSYRFDPPDLSINEWGVRQTLSFGGSRFGVAIPWSALFAITSHVSKEFWMFLEDLPPELLQSGAPGQVQPPAAPRPPGRPQLRTVSSAALPAAPAQPPPVEPLRGAGESSAKGSAEDSGEGSVQGSPDGLADAAPQTPPEEPKPPKPSRNHLRVVK